jgi:hypothetical protein
MAYYETKRNDTEPTEVTLGRGKGGVLPLVGATVVFRMESEGLTPVKRVTLVCPVVDADAGKVRIPWLAADVNVAGMFRAEFEVTFADGTIKTVPNSGWDTVKIYKDLG